MKKLVVFSGAGISAESGLKTFRDSDGLWENYKVTDVATPGAWMRDRALVLEFYNERRKQVLEAQPNQAHLAIAELEKHYDVYVVTQNIDDLHERAGSTKVLHLHGEIFKSRSTLFPENVFPIEGWQLNPGDCCPEGSQLRPHIVWFGEEVPMLEVGARIMEQADIVFIVGSSLTVYPAAGLIHYASHESEKYLIDPKGGQVEDIQNLHVVQKPATTGIPMVIEKLLVSDV